VYKLNSDGARTEPTPGDDVVMHRLGIGDFLAEVPLYKCTRKKAFHQITDENINICRNTLQCHCMKTPCPEGSGDQKLIVSKRTISQPLRQKPRTGKDIIKKARYNVLSTFI